MKKRLPLVFIVVLLFLYIIYFNSNTVMYIGKSNAVLKNHKYNSQAVYIIKFQAPFTKFEQYQLNENGEFIVPRGTEFIVSLDANVTRPLKWRLDQIKDNKILEYKKDNLIQPHDFKFTSEKGYSSRRQNFLFKAQSLGSEKLVFKYMDVDNSEVNSIMILNIRVE
ncbi:protease inhibitor I42 family protein [Clostridium estertheticum]|uniref:protease inhibitor I42 family protein n=1 Tax=Clostridium estertheticum TaxID=238834 RepID=UPI0013E91966|nr:protease inhibitor I42 family protein [Clostridium estertheticum]MBZ9685635.1 protease inhibitor I42 family protein [Clostridium estertheticum]